MPETLAFDKVLSSRSAEKRTVLIVIPVVVALAILVGFAAVAISRMTGLSTQVQTAQRQVEEANRAVEDRDRQLREARADVAILSTPGQGAAVLAAAVPDSGASGIARIHPERHAIALFAYNLMPPPEGQEYRLIVADPEGHEAMLGAFAPDDRGAASLLARDVPEGASRVEVALVPKQAQQGQPAPKPASQGGDEQAKAAPPPSGPRQPVLTGTLPKPGESGVVTASAPDRKVQARSPAGRR